MPITWDDPNARYYEHGLDRGVLYLRNQDPIPWNGLTGFDESSSGAVSMLYRDGVVYLGDVDASDFTGKMTALFWPDAFGECLGITQAADGMFVDNQKPKPFGLSYRTLVGSGTKGDMFGYQIHLVYGCMAAIGTRGRRSTGKETAPVEFDFDIVCTPVKLPGFRPTAHYILDTRFITTAKKNELEGILYGVGSTPGELPDPAVLFDLLNFGDAIIFTVHTNGTFTVEGSNANVYAIDEDHFRMDNINGVAGAPGYYTISDGGNTDVIIE